MTCRALRGRPAGGDGSLPLLQFGMAVLLCLGGTVAAAAQDRTDIAAMCGARKPCTLVQATPAGNDAQGRALTVVEIDLGSKNPDGDGPTACRPYAREFWLRTAGVAHPRRVLALCNDGYGASGVGEDEIAIAPNRMLHTQYGGSAWRWHEKRTIELSPLRVLTEQSCSYHNVNIGYSVSIWDWRHFAGERHWYPQACTDGDKRTDGKTRPDWCDARGATHHQALVPRLDGAMPAGALAHLGSCAATFDESGQRGYVLTGKPRANGAELRVLMTSARDLMVSVSDAAFASGAETLLGDDHVELWIGTDHSGLGCNGSRFKLARWAIGLEGKVQHADGDAAGPPEVVARAARTVGGRRQVTLHIRLAAADNDYLRTVTVGFSKGVDGKTARLTATSPVRRGDETTLSSIWKIEPKGARCEVRGGQLDLVETGLPALLGEK